MISQLAVIACCMAMVQLSLGENQYLSGAVISEVKRTIDLSSPIVKISLEFAVRNEGKNPLMKFPVSPEVEIHHVAFIEATQGDDTLIVHHPKERSSDSFYILDLKKPVQPGDKAKVSHLLFIPFSSYINACFHIHFSPISGLIGKLLSLIL